MSNEDFVVNAELRDDQGKGASRRLRREENKVPAIVYGGRKKPQNITLSAFEINKHLENEAFYSHIIDLVIDGKGESVILKDLQRHPAKGNAMHADFLRVSKTKKFVTKVPLHFINEETSKGVKMQGGTVTHSLSELEISCLPGDLPEFIEVDLINVEVGQTVHISDINLPKGVESVALSHGADHDLPVAAIQKGRGATASSDEEGGSEEGAE
ncbi:50S ribosomal protein L25/general stress protein Ctc [Teredinibacter sp. KSP-S5-2]|uniref:50S ribosomal protein L25/general stress protein Ctc n=1 Tax=Teredinibacter sp. KSP-S5-2 TaxID=3034506 RepID=UPI0029350E8C|nr:50S ribosomal protein L25/general stress protein Ctc [Teredinibacter sp. KSP-S5-2]WNO09560.1 50S ribosomal protein L25/general stress protein Ctc [Teredinibacter sp. KSP-S5-2]